MTVLYVLFNSILGYFVSFSFYCMLVLNILAMLNMSQTYSRICRLRADIIDLCLPQNTSQFLCGYIHNMYFLYNV